MASKRWTNACAQRPAAKARTGYPKLFPIIANKSAFPELTTLGIRRLPFCQNEKSFNRPGYDSGVKILEARGGKDNIATRLWWDTPAGNF